MKLLSSPSFLATLAFILSIGSIGTLVFLKKDELWPKKQAEAPRFPVLEFDDDVSSFSSQETHAMNELYKELQLAREAIEEKEKSFADRKRLLNVLHADLDAREKKLVHMQQKFKDALAAHAQSSRKVNEDEEKQIKKQASTFVAQDPKSVVKLIKQYEKDNNLDRIVQVLEYMKPDEIAPIFDEMIQEDDDASTKLVEDIAERLRTLHREPVVGAN